MYIRHVEMSLLFILVSFIYNILYHCQESFKLYDFKHFMQYKNEKVNIIYIFYLEYTRRIFLLKCILYLFIYIFITNIMNY